MTTPPEPAPAPKTAKDLLDWAESIICNAGSLTDCTQAEADNIVKKWRDEKHALFPDGVPAHPSPACAEAAAREPLLRDIEEMLITRFNYGRGKESTAIMAEDFLKMFLRHCSAPLAPAKQGGEVKAREVIERAFDDEPELPGDMPDEMWTAISGDREATQIALQTTARLTKQGIKQRLITALTPLLAHDETRLAITGELAELLVDALYESDNISVVGDGCRSESRDKFLIRSIVFTTLGLDMPSLKSALNHEADIFGNKPFRDWFDRCWPQPDKTSGKWSNWKHTENVAHAAWIAREGLLAHDKRSDGERGELKRDKWDWDSITDLYNGDGQELIDFLITHMLSGLNKALGGKGWTAYESDGGIDEAISYEINSLLEKNQAIDEWDHRPLGPLLFGLIKLTDNESSKGKWRVTLDYDNYQDGGRVLDGDGKIIGECYEERQGTRDEDGPNNQLVAAIIAAVDAALAAQTEGKK